MGVTGLTVIAHFSKTYEMEMARGRLDAEGIESFTANENILGILPLHQFALGGGVELSVAVENVERARTIIQAFEQDCSDSHHDATHLCPECGSENIHQPGILASLPAIVSLYFINILAWLIRAKHTCNDCGHRW